MNKQIKIFSCLFLVAAMGASSCTKDIVDTDNQVGHSKVTYYATITLTGDPYVSVVKGTSFTDPGAVADQKGTALEVKTSGSVDVNTVGIYNLKYTATNSDGFPASASRTVAVLPKAETAGVNISGKYTYVGSTYISTVTKLAPGFYSTDNCWGSSNIPIMFICVDGQNIDIADQSGGYGEIFGTGTITSGGALTYIVNLPVYGYSDIVRKWQKN